MRTIVVLILTLFIFFSCNDEEIVPEVIIDPKITAIQSLLSGTWSTDFIVIANDSTASGIGNIQTFPKEVIADFLVDMTYSHDEVSKITIATEDGQLKVIKEYLIGTLPLTVYWEIEIKNDTENYSGYENGYPFFIHERDIKGNIIRVYDVMAFNPKVNNTEQRISWLSVALLYDQIEKVEQTTFKYFHIQFVKV